MIADDTNHLRALLAEQTARAERAEAERDRLDAIVSAYPNATTNLARWAKPTIALIDAGALQVISPVEDEDADGGTPWPGQCIGALIDGFLDLASDVGKHNGDADELVHNAIDELRKVAAELRQVWCQRDQALAACAEMRAALEPFAAFCDAFDGKHSNLARKDDDPIYCFNDAAITLGMVRAARALLSRTDLGAGMVVVAGPLDALVDNLVRVVCDCHDGSDLWAHTRRDPEAFRRAVRGALLKKGGG